MSPVQPRALAVQLSEGWTDFDKEAAAPAHCRRQPTLALADTADTLVDAGQDGPHATSVTSHTYGVRRNYPSACHPRSGSRLTLNSQGGLRVVATRVSLFGSSHATARSRPL